MKHVKELITLWLSRDISGWKVGMVIQASHSSPSVQVTLGFDGSE